MPTFNDARIRKLNENPRNLKGDYVLYWMQISRRFDRNHSLDFALHLAKQLNKPLAIYEGLRIDYPWSCARHHQFFLEGMRDNYRKAKEIGINYWPYVETPERPARGLVRQLAQKACIVVTDDYPTFVVPSQIAALQKQIEVAFFAVDSNCFVPLNLLGAAVSAAAHLRPRIHKLFAEAWQHRAASEPDFSPAVRTRLEPPFPLWNAEQSIPQFLTTLKLAYDVPAPKGVEGGSNAGRDILNEFIETKLNRYAEERNHPAHPRKVAASRLSPYLRHGHISIQEVIERALNSQGEWTPDKLNLNQRGKREGFFVKNANVNSFLDEAIVWRDVGYHYHYRRNEQHGPCRVEFHEVDGEKIPSYYDLQSTLPAWAYKSLQDHTADEREYTYTLQELENAQTHDPLWNAAQKELVVTGRIHNYLRMLWGKKVLEWTDHPLKAYRILEHLNNKYAIDGRDPNSYTGILWCFGLFDRPWFERKIFGVIRYMSSDSTAKKYDLDDYYKYIQSILR
ncbi:MAG: deoxyribodipyrimidine photolyase [Gemmataceae bacterium]|nr:deoxyribodipyrimidine photolyase [Gemmataceae bacterium]